ncbi:VOC family protein [Zavarzinia sp. CC-PAN008]|uniref:VOC family protein n=1 Tax=Zavarzinia sp. CC-PAN008 TaxID=3243332 RepID=UPI003F7425C6
MIGYTTVGTNDMARALDFYDAVLGDLGGKRSWGTDRMQAYQSGGPGMFVVCTPYDGQAATSGNGTMMGFPAASQAAVDKAYATAIAKGAVCEGKPGDRGQGFYGAYFRDLDGNKLVVFNMAG